jgi:hypothetical protein
MRWKFPPKKIPQVALVTMQEFPKVWPGRIPLNVEIRWRAVLAEAHLTRHLFGQIVGRIERPGRHST